MRLVTCKISSNEIHLIDKSDCYSRLLNVRFFLPSGDLGIPSSRYLHRRLTLSRWFSRTSSCISSRSPDQDIPAWRPRRSTGLIVWRRRRRRRWTARVRCSFGTAVNLHDVKPFINLSTIYFATSDEKEKDVFQKVSNWFSVACLLYKTIGKDIFLPSDLLLPLVINENHSFLQIEKIFFRAS